MDNRLPEAQEAIGSFRRFKDPHLFGRIFWIFALIFCQVEVET